MFHIILKISKQIMYTPHWDTIC